MNYKTHSVAKKTQTLHKIAFVHIYNIGMEHVLYIDSVAPYLPSWKLDYLIFQIQIVAHFG